jgi:5-methylcytosine-specific restriction endonuclease McrA
MATKTKIGPKVRQAVIERDGTYCRYCGHGPMLLRWDVSPKGRVKLYNDWKVLGDRTIELDHVIPESKGGDSTEENLVVLCGDCNRRKWNREIHRVLRAPAPISFLPPPEARQIVESLPVSPMEISRRLRRMGIFV